MVCRNTAGRAGVNHYMPLCACPPLMPTHALALMSGLPQARGKIAAAKVLAPAAALAALDAAVQAHGGAGVSDDTPLARLWAGVRTLRIADGPDEVHLGTVAKLALRAPRL